MIYTNERYFLIIFVLLRNIFQWINFEQRENHLSFIFHQINLKFKNQKEKNRRKKLSHIFVFYLSSIKILVHISLMSLLQLVGHAIYKKGN
jgi:hypothetical protein